MANKVGIHFPVSIYDVLVGWCLEYRKHLTHSSGIVSGVGSDI